MSSNAPARAPRAPKAASRTRAPEKFADAEKLYGIENWGKGFFSVSDDGNLLVHPTRESVRFIDLKSVIDDVALRGISTPVVIRFPQILASAVRELNDAFVDAIKEYDYDGVYRGVFPIKVNQKKVVVNEVIEAGRQYSYGLEAGSKPELLAALVVRPRPRRAHHGNGYKDEAFIRLALNGIRMGKTVVMILEKVSELERILDVAKRRGVRPLIGMRSKLYARGSGKWAKSGGESAKFGLTTTEMLEAVEILKSKKMLDCLVMLHFHIGSQITDIRKIKQAIREAGRVYAKLRRSGVDDRVPEPRRRPRRRLRRVEDGLRLLDELHGPGVRPRRRLHDQDDLRRGEGPRPDPRDRVRARRDGLPLGPRHERRRRGGPDRAGPDA